VTEPSMILADEPTGALDTRTSEEILALLQDLNRTRGMTVVLVTHELDVAQHAGRLIQIRDGLISADEPVATPRQARQVLVAADRPGHAPADGNGTQGHTADGSLERG
jgi:putative ABC transport system ATP-binding protein